MNRLFTRFSSGQASAKVCNLAICAIFRNEANNIQEWLEFHQRNGVTRFFLINHRSEDDFRTVLEPWIREGIVTLVDASSDDQVLEYNKILSLFGSRVRWMAFIDIDEFLFSPRNWPLPTVLRKFKRASGVFVYWRLFGSSAVQNMVDPGKTLESFQLCLAPPRDLDALEEQQSTHKLIRDGSKMTGSPIQGKCIIRPSKVSEIGVHWPTRFVGVMADERGSLSKTHFPKLRPTPLPSTELLRINHYWSRSLEELSSKSSRQPVNMGLRNDSNFVELPGQRCLRWDTHLNSSLDNAALENIGADLPFVFFIGFNKTATKSLHDFMVINGFPAVHWDRNRLVAAMLENIKLGQRILSGYEHLRVFSDFTLITDVEYFEGNSMFRELFQSYPSAYFILNNRDTGDWIKSRQNHHSGLFSERHLKIRGIKTTEELSQAWASEKSRHEHEVREFFADHPRFLEIDINDQDVPSKLGKFLGRQFTDMKWKVVRSLHRDESVT